MCTVNATVTTADNTLILNDNFPSTSQKAFPVFLSDEPLPGSGLCSYGDLHTHSHYSESHVEFGPPITVIAQMAEAYGLDFVAVTDHSYDLECRIDDIYRKDHDGTRWSLLDQELNCLAGQQVTVIKGEEVSVMNATGSVVHLCALGVNTMLPGGRDGARRNARNAKTLSISNAVEEIHRQRGLSVAAHPGARSGLLQHLFLGRGGWQDRDVQDGLDAYQALNGAFNSQWYRAKRQWVRKLLHGLRLPLVAGNDAHGDFNRYRALTVPFVAVGEDFLRSFANCRTGVYGRRDTPESILTAIRQGRTFVTNGPFLTLSLTELPDEPAISQQNIPGTTRSLFAHVQSCYEFGKPVILRLLRGYFQTGKERPLLVCAPRLHNSYCGLQEIALDRDNGPGYIRAEVVCRTDGNRIFEAATSPCYFD
jgi:predicted metal-dependent phosphoesterase TrpH